MTSSSESASAAEDAGSNELLRLNRFLAAAGLGSRRKVEALILEGRVAVNGRVVTELGQKVRPDSDEVELDGERIRAKKKQYFLVNKPTGYVCTHRDPNGRPRAIDLVPMEGEQLFPVGRLDATSEGLLLITNDGAIAQKMAHPRYQIVRTYKVQVAGEPSFDTLRQLRDGLHFAEGKFKVERVKKLKSQGQSTWLEVDLKQGRNREIRRMLARVGHKVISLQRIAFGDLKLGRLKSGEFRPLTAREVAELEKSLASGSSQTQSRRKTPHGKPRAARTTKIARGPKRPSTRSANFKKATKSKPRGKR